MLFGGAKGKGGTPLSRFFAIMVVFWFFLGFGDYQGLSLWNYSILAEKKKMDCADPVLFLWGRLQYYPGLTPLAKRQSQWPLLWQKHSICKERRKSHHNDVWLFCLTRAAGPWDPWTATQPPPQWLLYKRTNTTLQISSCNTQRQCTCHHTTTWKSFFGWIECLCFICCMIISISIDIINIRGVSAVIVLLSVSPIFRLWGKLN